MRNRKSPRRQHAALGVEFVKRHGLGSRGNSLTTFCTSSPVSGDGSRPMSFLKSCWNSGSLKVRAIASRRIFTNSGWRPRRQMMRPARHLKGAKQIDHFALAVVLGETIEVGQPRQARIEAALGIGDGRMEINLIAQIFQDTIDIARSAHIQFAIGRAMSISGSLKPTTKRGSFKSNRCANMRPVI